MANRPEVRLELGTRTKVRAAHWGAVIASYLLASAVFHPSVALGDELNVRLPPALAGHYDYPASARRLDQQGRFLVELSITGEGRVIDVGVLSAEPTGIFDRSLAVNLRKLRFSVPGDWEGSRRSMHRFRVNILFLVRPCRATGPCSALNPLTADPVITFTAAPIGGVDGL